MRKRAYRPVLLSIALLCTALLFGCEKPDDKPALVSPITSESSSQQNVKKESTKSSALVGKTDTAEVFAPTISNERRGIWLGGPPPMNKGASDVLTYYRMKAGDKPNLLTVTLRFEGIVASDAEVKIKPIDGAKFKKLNQRSTWRLTPDTPSEVTFIVEVPENVSYITVNTLQNGRGSARAFILEAQ